MSQIIYDPLVSVILPVYNGAEFVGKAVESVLCQTYRHLEVIAIDDGSSDQTLAILEGYAAGDSRMVVFSQKNSGVARARNRAVAGSNGDLIAPLDADDLWEPTKIARQVQQLQQSGERTGLVYSWWVWIDAAGLVLDRSPGWTFEGEAFEKLLQINFTGNASIPLFRRHCLEEVGGYNEDLAANNAGGCEDWELVLRIAERYDVAVVKELLVGYRRRSGSMSTACETMSRSQQRVMNSMRILRPELGTAVFRRATFQFNLYLSGLSFWSGNLVAAVRWGLRSGIKLPLRIAPYVVLMLLTLGRRKRPTQTMLPGVALDIKTVHHPFLPYDRIHKA
jgi:glycosyltransferase involved in cell wall biosynthesis